MSARVSNRLLIAATNASGSAAPRYDIGSSSQIARHDRTRARIRRASVRSGAEELRRGLAPLGRRGTACGTHCVIFLQWPDTDVPVLMARMMPARLVEAGYQEVW
jgi:hypothetical protein